MPILIGCGGGEAGEANRLTIAVPEDEGPINIFAGVSDPLTYLVYDKLLAPSPYVDEPQPWLAESVERVDPSTWEVTVRDGVTWHDGELFTAEDVKFTLDYFLEAPTGRWPHHINEVPHVDQVEVVDDATLRMSCAYPCPDLGPITLADIPILPQHIWEEVGDPNTYTELPMGTGPYRLVGYSTEQGYRFEANEDYFAGEPLVGELIMPVIEDPSATFTALGSGEIDGAARTVPPELLTEFENAQGIEVATTDALQLVEMRLNFGNPPLEVPEFRRALSLAIDREELLERVLLGQGRPGTQGHPHPDSPWTNPENGQPYEPEEARRVLDELGFIDGDGDGFRETPEGDPLEFAIAVAGTEPTEIRAAGLVSDQLADIGIEATVEAMDPGTLRDSFDSPDLDLFLYTPSTHSVADPTQFIMSHRSGTRWDLPEVPYPEMEALIEEWMQTTTVEDRTEVLFEMQELFNNQPTSIVLYSPEEHRVYRPEAYDEWVESPGFGIMHKWSFLPEEVRNEANAVAREIEE